MSYSTKLTEITREVVCTRREVYSLGDYPIDRAHLVKTSRTTIANGEVNKVLNPFRLGGEVKKYNDSYKPVFVKPTFFTLIAKTSPPFTDKFLNKNTIRSGFEEVEDDWKIVWFSYGRFDSAMLDDQLNPLPVVFDPDKYGNIFTDQYMNVNGELLEFLRNHPWVVNKKRIQIEKNRNLDEGWKERIKVVIRPDAKTYKEIWDFYANEPSISYRVYGAVLGHSYAMAREGKDWLGIHPFLLSA